MVRVVLVRVRTVARRKRALISVGGVPNREDSTCLNGVKEERIVMRGRRGA
jgi:hypothetical protein